ncbi:MAG: hypothetical protein ACE5FK_03280 [Candidatus Methylomirabilia bacterium]
MRLLLVSVFFWLTVLPATPVVASHTDYLFDPRQFRHHAESGSFEIFWNYGHPSADVLRARGYVRAKAQSPDVEVITLELIGMDGAGSPVSHAFGFTMGGKIFPWESRPFAIRLRLTGQEKSFRLHIWHLEHHH